MFKIEIISTYSDRIMEKKEIFYTRDKETAEKFVSERTDIETRNQFVYIEETYDATKINIDIPDFYRNIRRNQKIHPSRVCITKYEYG